MSGDDEVAEMVDAEGFRTIMPGVKYKEIVAGTGPQAEYKQAVIASWEAVLVADGRVFEVGKRKMLRVGEGDAPPGLELGLRQLQEGTKCVVRAESRFAWGESGRPASIEEGTLAVPPNADVEWRIEAHRLWYKEADEAMTPADQLVEARNKKVLGNEHFHHENWSKAASNYQDILKGLNVWNFDEGTEDRIEAETIYVDCGNNLVFALTKMDEWLKAEQAVCDVLTVAPEHKKALYRATQVALHLSKWQEAQAALAIALEKWPESRDFRDLYETLRDHKRKYRERKAKMSSKMSKELFSGSDEKTPVTGPPQHRPQDDDAAGAATAADSSRRCALQ